MRERGPGQMLAGAVLAVLLSLAETDSAAQPRRPGPGLNDGFDTGNPLSIRAPREAQEKAGLINTGLKPVYPTEARCLEVASFFGDRTRYDGSSRFGEANNGYHAGIDISAPEGTLLLAIADGAVIHKREGGMLAGIQIYLQHAPADTGFDVWLVSKYQHLQELPRLEVGERVRVGQEIGRSGKTGTVGPHYRAGYPHLHLSLFLGATERFTTGMAGPLPDDGKFLDPLALYAGKRPDNHAILALPEAEKRFAVPYRTVDGTLVPAGTRVVWPFACVPR